MSVSAKHPASRRAITRRLARVGAAWVAHAATLFVSSVCSVHWC